MTRGVLGHGTITLMSEGVGQVVSAVFGLVVLLAILIAVGWVAGRILGVHRGFLRAALAGIIGFAAGWILVAFQTGSWDFNDPSDVWGAGLGFILYVLFITLLASVVIDALLRPRVRRQLRIPHPIRVLRLRLSVASRIRQIIRAARSNGLVGRRVRSVRSLATPEGARALRLTLEQSGGMLIKFGQIASTREDLIPAVVTRELAELRTAVPGLTPEEVREVIERELGSPLEVLFAEFDLQPLAAASIGVTHRATLPDGRKVIVKVQRPGVEESVDRDGRVLIWLARQLNRRSESAARLGVGNVVTELVNGVKQELDFTREAANNATIRRARLHDKGVAFPEIFSELTTRRVLVMAEVTGVPVSDTEALDASDVPREELAVNLLNSFLSQVLQDGVYHADPHPGNILIDPQGTEWFIDYGAVGYLDPVTLEALQQMAFGFSMRDPSLLARSVRRMAGRDGEDIDMASLEFELGVALTEVQGSSFDPRAIQVVIRTLSRHGIGVPRALTVLGRALLTLDGTLRIIDPNFRMGPAAQARMSEIAVGALADPEQEFFKELVRSLPSLRMLPQLSEDIALQARSGRLTLRVDRFSGHDGAKVQSWLDSILFATLGVFGLIGSVLLFIAAGMAGNAEYSGYLRIVGAIGLLISIAMQMRVIARILSRRSSDDLV